MQPEKLYKYMTFEAGINSLNAQTLRFSSPFRFNDPFDGVTPFILETSNMNLKNEFINALKNFLKSDELHKFKIVSEETIQQLRYTCKHEVNKIPFKADFLINSIRNNILKPMRILCMSSRNDSILMWSHYAKDHQGLVLEFNRNLKFFKGFNKVNYDTKPLRLRGHFLKDITLKNTTSQNEIKSLFLTKYKDWEYEREWRNIIGLDKFAEEIEQLFDSIQLPLYQKWKLKKSIQNNEEIVDFYFSKQALHGVYVGLNCNILDELKVCELIKEKYGKVPVYKSFKKEDSFAIEFKRIQ